MKLTRTAIEEILKTSKESRKSANLVEFFDCRHLYVTISSTPPGE